MKNHNQHSGDQVTLVGMIMALGIVFSDLGTTPLYLMNAILGGSDGVKDQNFILGIVSCLIWTLTLQATIKYVFITMRADNQGEGGIMALYALVRGEKKKLFLLAILGSGALLANGVIAPSITVLSAAEGVQMKFPTLAVLPVAVGIIIALFLVQKFGTTVIGKSFGPVMLVWFITLAGLGLPWIIRMPGILKAFNPVYAINLLLNHPGGFLLLGAVFLVTTGAEALYSDLNHCGYRNIKVSWFFVKASLITNYLGQAAWILLENPPTDQMVNPFFGIMPAWFLPAGVLLATAAAAIAGLTMINRSHAIISDAISLNLWPKCRIRYPVGIKSWLYLPSLNWIMLAACLSVILVFRNSSDLEVAYSLATNITMMMTTILLTAYLKIKDQSKILLVIFASTFLFLEGSFLTANLMVFIPGGWLTVALVGPVIYVMYIWFRARQIRNSYTRFVTLEDHYRAIEDLSRDVSVPKCATNLVYLTRANKPSEIETKIIHSIFQKTPKRADTYWLLHVNFSDDPHTLEYSVDQLIPGILIRMEFRLGFKVRPRINLLFNQVIKEMSCNHEIDFLSRYPSLRKHDIPADFRFILIHRIRNFYYNFPGKEQLVMDHYNLLSRLALTDIKFYGLDASNAVTEEVPLINVIDDTQLLKRVFHPD